MLKIRLKRRGASKKPFYQIVVCNSRVSVNGKIIEMLGKYDPKLNPPLFEINRERVDYWVKKGAKISKRVEFLLKGSETPIGGTNEGSA